MNITLQMADYYQATPAHAPAQQLYQAQPQAQSAPPPPAQPQPLPPPNSQPTAAPHPYGHTPHPAPYGYQGAPGEALPPGHVTKRPLEEGAVGPTPAKFLGVGRGRGKVKNPGHLWAWQQVGFFEDMPNPMPCCQAHRARARETCFTYLPTKK